MIYLRFRNAERVQPAIFPEFENSIQPVPGVKIVGTAEKDVSRKNEQQNPPGSLSLSIFPPLSDFVPHSNI